MMVVKPKGSTERLKKKASCDLAIPAQLLKKPSNEGVPLSAELQDRDRSGVCELGIVIRQRKISVS